MPRRKRPREWFKLYSNTRHVFSSLSDETVGKAIKLAQAYYVDGELPPDGTNPLTMIAFNVLRSAADEAIEDYEAAVANGAKGPEAKEAKQQETMGNPPLTRGNPR